MTEEEARALIAVTPEWIVAPCPWCGATTEEEAGEKCRPTQGMDGDYTCGTPEEAPVLHGNLTQRNPAHDKLTGYLWGWQAVHDGLTKIAPKWEEEDSDA
jgi:hypothetical protein